MQSSRNSLLLALALIVGGALIGPGFGYLVKWRKAKDR